jgi:hypothetical protein
MPAYLERCVKKVRASGYAVNPWAVCVTAMKRKKKNKSARRARKR